MIQVNYVSKSFQTMNRNAVQNVSFVAKPGCITGLLGANGSGKTTLMRLISGAMIPDSGSISICGADVHKNSIIAKQHLGVLLGGDISLYNRLTAYENIMYFAKLQGVDTHVAKQRIYEFAHILDMDDFLNRRVAGFSRGMRQKIAFCRTVIHNPSVILLDEPSTGLDIYSIRDVEKFILYYKSLGKTILLSTHNAHEIETLCDHLIILREGQVLMDSPYRQALDRTNSTNAMELFFHFEEAGR